MSDRWSRIVDAFAGYGEEISPGAALCDTAVATLSVWGAAIALTAENGAWGPLSASSQGASSLEELQFTLGIGPIADVNDGGRPVSEPDLRYASNPRWAGFAEAALEAGVMSIHCFPLHIGVARIGAMTLYDDQAGLLDVDRYADGLALASVAARVVLAAQSELPPGGLMAELSNPAAYRAEVHQASGMVSAQLDIPVADALARLRARAWASGRTVSDIAADVVARRTRVDP